MYASIRFIMLVISDETENIPINCWPLHEPCGLIKARQLTPVILDIGLAILTYLCIIINEISNKVFRSRNGKYDLVIYTYFPKKGLIYDPHC